MKYVLLVLAVIFLLCSIALRASAEEGKLIIIECPPPGSPPVPRLSPCHPRVKLYDGQTACDLDTAQLAQNVPSGSHLYCGKASNWLKQGDEIAR